jgi:hypothetical protein
VNRDELMTLFRMEMFASANLKMNPFFKSMQRKLAVLRGLDCIAAHERSLANDLRRSREFSGTFLNSTKHPQALLINTLMVFGDGVLKTLPVFAAQSDMNIPIILPLIENLTSSFTSFSDSSMFHAWAPRASPPMKPVALNVDSAKASGGHPKEAVDGQKVTMWSISSSKGEWSVDLENKSDIQGLRIAWAPPTSANSVSGATAAVVGAPKKLVVRVYFTPVDPSSDMGEKDYIFEPEHEFQRQGNWVQTYLINLANVTSIKLYVSKYCMPNQSSIRIYNLEVLRINNDAVWTETRDTLNNIELGLFPLVKYEMLQFLVIRAVLSLLRTSASLGLSLQFMKFAIMNDVASSVISSESKPMFAFLSAIHAQIAKQKCRVIFGTGDTVEEAISDVCFDAKAKSTDITLEEEGTVAVSPSSGINSYALATVEMNEGIWIWEMVILEDSYGDESTCLGVGRRPVLNSNYESSADMWTIRCYSGETYHAVRIAGRNVNPPIHPNDVCRFTYDADRMTVSLAVNDTDRGILFDNVPPGVSPLAFFYGSKKKIQIMNMRHRLKHTLDNAKSVDLSVAGPLPSEDEIRANPSILSLVLQMISSLCDARMAFFEYREKERKPKNTKLDYPFCVEASVSVMSLILDLLELSKSRLNEARVQCLPTNYLHQDVISLLSILQSQFYVIKQSNIDLHEIGFPYRVSKKSKLLSFHRGEGLDFINRAKGILSSIMKDENPKICNLAIGTYAQGSLLFFPNMDDKVSALSEILADIKIPSTLPGDLLLLNMILKDLASCSSALQIIELIVSKPGFESTWMKIEEKLFLLLAYVETHNVTSSSDIGVDRDVILSLFSYLQQQIFYEQTVDAKKNLDDDMKVSPLENILVHQANGILHVSLAILAAIEKLDVEKVSGSKINNMMQESCINILLNPMAHMLCFCSTNCRVIQGVLPNFTLVFDTLSRLVKRSSYCQRYATLFQNSIPKNLPSARSSGVTGWKVVQCRLEESVGAFSIRDNGLLFHSLHSSNTCAAGNYVFPANSKGAWEFKLEQDSLNDECSVFGAARPTFTSRCYNSSPDLWMRRSYNGSLYQNGTTLVQSMDKIHPGDVIRIEFDGKLGTLSSSVNGSQMEVMFTGIHESVVPVCGSYRSGIQIRLLKVEIYQDSSSDNAGDSASLNDHETLEWITDSSRNDSRELSTLRMAKDYKPIASHDTVSWVTCRTNNGFVHGVHDIAFEFIDNKSKDLVAMGLCFGSEPRHNGDHIAGKSLKPASAKTSTSKEMSSTQNAAASTSRSETPVASESPSNVDTPSSTNGDKTNDISSELPLSSQPELRRNRSESNNADPPSDFLSTYVYVPAKLREVSWKSDGSLWVNGEEKAKDFGSKYLPLKPLASVTMRVNLDEKTLSFYVNGSFAGVAFGPSWTNPAVVLPIEIAKNPKDKHPIGIFLGSKKIDEYTIYPAVSISSSHQSVRAIPAGFYGTLLLPAQILVQKTLASVIGRLCASLMCGSPKNKLENEISPWLQSPLLRGGMENDSSDSIPSISWTSASDNCRKKLSKLLSSLQYDNTPTIPLVEEQLPAKMHDASSKVNFKAGQFPEFDDVGSFLTRLSTAKPIADVESNGSLQESVDLAMSWLESIQPEMASMRDIMERRGLYSFPVCERPYIACLLKHSGLVKEIMVAVDCLKKKLPIPTPSTDMVSLWLRIKQLRQYLRKKRQDLAAKAEDMSPSKDSAPILDSLGNPNLPEQEIVPSASPESSQPAPEASGDLMASAKPSAVEVTAASAAATETKSFITENVIWKEQRPGVISSFEEDDRFNCKVLSVGVDFAEELLFIRFSVTVDISSDTIDETLPESSHITINEESFGNPKAEYTRANRNSSEGTEEITGCLKFDIGGDFTHHEILSANVTFTFSSVGYVSTKLQIPSDNGRPKSTETVTVEHFELKSLLSFDEICSVISERACLLLNMSQAWMNDESYNNFTSKRLLLSLMDRYTTKQVTDTADIGKLSSAPGGGWGSPARDRWSRVIQFLRVHSRIRKQYSNPSSLSRSSYGDMHVIDDFLEMQNAQQSSEHQSNSDSDDIDHYGVSAEMSSAQAAIQACALFVTGEAVNISPKGVISVIKRRTFRANQRIFALDALRSVIEDNISCSDPFSLSNMLIFIPSSFMESNQNASSAANDVKSSQRIHYLINLEGASIESLTKVQEAFMGCFTSLVNVASNYVQSWETASSQILHSSAEYYNPRIYLEVITMILSMWSINFSNRDFRFLVHCGLLPLLFKIVSLVSFEKSIEIWSSMAATCVDSMLTVDAGGSIPSLPIKPFIKTSSLYDGLRNGTCSYRYVLWKLLENYPHVKDLPFINQLLPKENGNILLSCASPAEVLRAHEEAKSILNAKFLEDKSVEESRNAETNDKKLKSYEKIKARMISCGAFDEPQFSTMSLSQHNLVLTIRNDRSNVVQCITASFEYDFDLDPATNYGNYFEVEVIELGSRDIGIGLADMSHFPLSTQMPGWDDHSYGYHGDDGRKFGKNKVASVWPTFEEGDIIGCGFVKESETSSSIFYTRNGELLGTAFTSVPERKLKPVVGFTNRSASVQQVRINFGLLPFRYSGENLVMNPKALVERTIQSETAEPDEGVTEELQSSGSSIVNVVGETLNITEASNRLQAATTYLVEYSGLRSISFVLLRHLLLILDSNEPEEVVNDPLTSGENNILSSKTTTVLNRGLSSFGTLKSITMEDGKILREEVTAMMIQEVLLGSKYINSSMSKSLESPRPLMTISHSTERLLTTSFVGKFWISEVQNDGDPMTGLTSKNSQHGILEIPEVESVLHSHLRVLLSLLPLNTSLKDEMLSVRSLHGLFAVLRGNSLKLQQIVIKICQVILPDAVPDDVEAAVTSDSLDGTIAATPRRHRRVPDTFIRIVLDKIRRSIMLPTSAADSPPSQPSAGYGMTLLCCSDEYIRLIQILIENPIWTEIVACSLTDAFRQCINFANTNLTTIEPSQSWSDEANAIIGIACSAAACLSSIEVVREGTLVNIPSGALATVLSINLDNNTAQVFSGDLLGVVGSSDIDSKLETFPIPQLSAVRHQINLDFSRLSQPLIPNLVELFKLLLLRFDSLPLNDTFEKRPFTNQILNRAVFFMATAVAALLEYQNEALNDSIQNIDILQHIVSLSLLPASQSSGFNAKQLQLAWLAHQSNILDTRTGPKVNAVSNIALEESTSNQFLSPVILSESMSISGRIEADPVSQTSSSTAAVAAVLEQNSSILLLNSKSYSDAMLMADELSLSFNLSSKLCQRYLQFYNMDVEATRAALSNISSIERSSDKSTDMKSRQVSRALSARSMKDADLQDSNILLNVDVGVVPEPTSASAQLTSSRPTLYLESIRVDDLGSFEPWTLLTESDGIGLVDDLQSKLLSFVSVGVGPEELIVGSYDSILGQVVYDTKPCNKLKLIKSWYDKDFTGESVPTLDIDVSLALTKIRSISSTLLLDGSIASTQSTNTIEDWIRLVKLNYHFQGCRAGASSISHALDLNKLFRAILSMGNSINGLVTDDAATNLEIPSTLSYLIDDLKANLKMLTYSPLQSGKKKSYISASADTAVDFEGYSIGSPHPFFSPCTIIGELEIPSNWSGLTIKFDPLFDLSSELAMLGFYKSREDLMKNNAFFSIQGGKNIIPGPINKSDVNSVFYKFDAKAGAEKKILQISSTDDNILIKGNSASMRRDPSVPVGLGEEDTLFSLFDTSGGVSLDSVGLFGCNMDGVASGSWFFEVKIKFTSNVEDIMNKTMIGIIDARDSSDLTGYILGSTGYKLSVAFSPSAGVLYSQGTAIELTQAKYETGAVHVGCLFQFVAGGFSVQFARNGAWFDPHVVFLPAEKAVDLILKPMCNVGGNADIDCNFGEDPFQYPPNHTAEAWDALHNRPEDISRLGWGFEFTVSCVYEIGFKLCRKFTNIYKPEDEEKVKPEDCFWVWRPATSKPYGSIGDIITFTNECPIGALVVDEEKCVRPESFELVVYSSSLNVSIWRPIPPEGYAALGDVVVNKGSLSKPKTDCCFCVPTFALEKCFIGKKLLSSRKGGSSSKYFDFSIWSANNELGTFFASPCDRTELIDTKTKPEDIVCTGIGNPHRLARYSVGNAIQGEWINERDIENGPSVSWTIKLMQFLLDDNVMRKQLLEPQFIQQMLDYFRSELSPDIIRLLPFFIQVIRYANRCEFELPENNIEGLSLKIFNHALRLLQEKASQKVPDRLLALMDVVVEFEHWKLTKKNRALLASASLDVSPKLSDSEPIISEATKIFDERSKGDPALTIKSSSDSENISPGSIADEWWLRRKNSSEVINKAMMNLDDTELELLLNPKTSDKTAVALDYLRSNLSFFYSLDARNDGKAQAHEKLNIFMAKVWYKFFSNCVFLESDHPCRMKSYSKRVYIPGAEKLKITFDKRNSIPTEGSLTITPAIGSPLVFSSTSANWTESSSRSLTWNGDSLTISYEDTSTGEGAGTDIWGWALLISASGPIYEGNSMFIEVPHESTTVPDTSIQLQDISLNEGDPESSASSASAEARRPPSRRESRSNEKSLKVDKQSDEKEVVAEVNTSGGAEVTSGWLEVPYASEVELFMERLFLGDEADMGRVNIDLTYTDSGERNHFMMLWLSRVV